jgi:hypothetical protein
MEQSKEELLNKIRDPKFYLENFCKIKGKKPGSLIPFILNEAQKDLFNTVKKRARVIILKCRQLGFSTAMVGYFYHNTIMNPGTTTAVIGYNSSLTTELLDKVKTFYRTTPESLRPTIHYNSKYEVSFPRIDSKIVVLPSTEEVGRGYTLSNVLATELAFWDKADEKMATLEASVPIDGKLVIESTPNGIGNLYHRKWTEENDYAKKEYGWWWGYTEEEIETIRRRINDPRKFAQEYELSFLSSGNSVFSNDLIEELRKGILRLNDEITENLIGYRVIEDDGLIIYREPEADGIYVCGVDPSEGIKGGDYAAATFFNRKTGEEVASYRGYLPPDILAKKLNDWGRKFNNALMVVEVNNHGLTVITVLKYLLYPSLFFRSNKIESLGSSMSDKLGWKTTKVTREILIDDYCKAIREKSLKLHSDELIKEMSVFVYNERGDAIAQAGFHDDLIFSAALAFQGFKVLYSRKLDQLNYASYLPVNFSY